MSPSVFAVPGALIARTRPSASSPPFVLAMSWTAARPAREEVEQLLRILGPLLELLEAGVGVAHDRAVDLEELGDERVDLGGEPLDRRADLLDEIPDLRDEIQQVVNENEDAEHPVQEEALGQPLQVRDVELGVGAGEDAGDLVHRRNLLLDLDLWRPQPRHKALQARLEDGPQQPERRIGRQDPQRTSCLLEREIDEGRLLARGKAEPEHARETAARAESSCPCELEGRRLRRTTVLRRLALECGRRRRRQRRRVRISTRRCALLDDVSELVSEKPSSVGSTQVVLSGSEDDVAPEGEGAGPPGWRQAPRPRRPCGRGHDRSPPPCVPRRKSDPRG